eukprot:3804861-Rhodomonas_salina.4
MGAAVVLVGRGDSKTLLLARAFQTTAFELLGVTSPNQADAIVQKKAGKLGKSRSLKLHAGTGEE